MPSQYSDGGYTGANIERPGVRQLMTDIEAGKIDCVVVYKVDRLSRSLIDFAKMMGLFEQHGVCFVSVTQQFNTNIPLGRLTLNILLSFRAVCGARDYAKRKASGERSRLHFGDAGLRIIPARTRKHPCFCRSGIEPLVLVAGTPRQRNPQPGDPSFGDRFFLRLSGSETRVRPCLWRVNEQ